MLYMGARLAKHYLLSLKNIHLCMLSSSGVMAITDCILTDLLSTTRDDADWAWVTEAYARVKKFAELKQLADGLFKDGMYSEAIRFYTDALKVPMLLARHLSIQLLFATGGCRGV